MSCFLGPLSPQECRRRVRPSPKRVDRLHPGNNCFVKSEVGKQKDDSQQGLNWLSGHRCDSRTARFLTNIAGSPRQAAFRLPGQAGAPEVAVRVVPEIGTEASLRTPSTSTMWTPFQRPLADQLEITRRNRLPFGSPRCSPERFPMQGIVKTASDPDCRSFIPLRDPSCKTPGMPCFMHPSHIC